MRQRKGPPYAFTYAAGSPRIIVFTSAAERRVLLAVGLALAAAVIFAVTRTRFPVAKTDGRP